MATVVYQGFQSHFESQHFEPRALRLRLSSPNNPHFSTPLKSHFLDSSSITSQDNATHANVSSGPNSDSNSDSKSWSFLESLSNSSSEEDKEKKTLSPYVHPRSSRRNLSDESLALCTESLGSETGSDIIHEDDDFFSLQTTETRTSASTSRSSSSRESRKRNVLASLPPPLTSMRGFDGIEVKSHRENGRLVMTAVRAPPRNRCLQDRSYGCVRLAFLIDSDDHIESESNEEEETIEMERDNEEEIPEFEEEEEIDEEEEEIQVMVMEKVQRSRRCVEADRENRGFLNWESLCVATS